MEWFVHCCSILKQEEEEAILTDLNKKSELNLYWPLNSFTKSEKGVGCSSLVLLIRAGLSIKEVLIRIWKLFNLYQTFVWSVIPSGHILRWFLRSQTLQSYGLDPE